MNGVLWKIPACDRVHVPRDLYAMDIREVAQRLNISRGLAFILEKSALAKLRKNGQMKALFELSRLKSSLHSETVFPVRAERGKKRAQL
jgi:hypothetical protein